MRNRQTVVFGLKPKKSQVKSKPHTKSSIDLHNQELKNSSDVLKKKLNDIHSRLKFEGGSLKDEMPEQLLTLQYLDKTAKVLEIGSNLGRNSLLISTILDNDQNFVTLECNQSYIEKLTNNRNMNNRKFHIEASALSKQKLFQKGWNTYSESTKPEGSVIVNTITWLALQEKYKVSFDTLIADCEGALYYILTDFPDLLDNIKLIIVENDYDSMVQKVAVDKQFEAKGFSLVTSQPGPHYVKACRKIFYEVWKKTALLEKN